jgi:hypothetical protein
LLPSLLPPKPSLSSSHSTLVANTIAGFIPLAANTTLSGHNKEATNKDILLTQPLALFVTRHLYPHRHRLAALTLWIYLFDKRDRNRRLKKKVEKKGEPVNIDIGLQVHLFFTFFF